MPSPRSVRRDRLQVAHEAVLSGRVERGPFQGSVNPLDNCSEIDSRTTPSLRARYLTAHSARFGARGNRYAMFACQIASVIQARYQVTWCCDYQGQSRDPLNRVFARSVPFGPIQFPGELNMAARRRTISDQTGSNDPVDYRSATRTWRCLGHFRSRWPRGRRRGPRRGRSHSGCS